jgi:sensor histidine kinase YesM
LTKKISISLYWKCQLIGWSVASLYWSFLGLSGGKFNLLVGLLQFISDVFVYVLITHLYRTFAIEHNWQQLGINPLIKRIIPAIVVMGIAYLVVTIVKVYLFRLWLVPENTAPFFTFFKHYWSAMLVAGIRLMSIWLLAYHLYHYAQREINMARENARLSILTRDAQLNNLSAQLNPHFLFNSLNNIKALVIENPKSARRAIDLLSDLLRNALYNKEAGTITLKEELNLVKDYLELEKLRLEERLQFTIQANDNLNDFLIPRFCIQTLAENAIKHGVDKQKQGGPIDISVTSLDNLVHISITNPGKFDINQSVEGIGVKNLTQRLQLQYNGRAIFHIANYNEKTVLSTITIPRV